MSAEPLRVLEGGLAPRGWEELWGRDQWRAHELPHGDLAGADDGRVILHFEGLIQPWLQEAAKRWARARLLASMAPKSMSDYLFHLRAFSRWLGERAPEVGSPATITRILLEDYMLWVRTSGVAAGTQQARIGTLRAFLEEQSEDGLAGLPRGAVIHAAEIPRVGYRLPQGLERHVFDRFVDPANLALLSSEQHRTMVLLLAFTGLRVSSIVTLGRDALEIGSDGHPYLRYRNVKLRREAVIPIGPALSEQLRRQEDHLNATYGPEGTDWLLPSPPKGRRGPSRGGGHHISREMIRLIVKGYVRKAEIRDGDGRLATWVHPHLFRHHLGTSMVNDGVPLPVIQRVLDHASIEMTAHYAQLHDETLRREITRWHERVNIRGERIALPLDGPLGQAAWMKERIAHARQALPNGFCGLPLVQTCPHPNACLSCDNFLTDPLVPVGPRATARPHHAAARARRAERELAARRGARTRPAVPDPDPRRPGRGRSRPARERPAGAGCGRARRRPPASGRGPDGVSDERGEGLRAAAAARSLDAAERARRALVDLHRRSETITFAGVAARADVSRQFLYTHVDLRAEIERLRSEPQPAPTRLPSREPASDASIRTRLRAALDENKRLREELAALRDELALTHGHVRELELAKRRITRA